MSTVETELAALEQTLASLESSPLYAYRIEQGYQSVLGEGSPTARLMLIGEAPGEREAKAGRPFIGASGRLLDQLLASIDLARDDIYITNVVKDRPPENRDPRAAELQIYTPLLVRQLELIQPPLVATLGRFAMSFIFELFEMPQQGQKIGQLHGQYFTVEAAYGPVTIVPLYHPAVALYDGRLRATLFDDFQTIKTLLAQA